MEIELTIHMTDDNFVQIVLTALNTLFGLGSVVINWLILNRTKH